MPKLVITVDFSEQADLDALKVNLVGAVEELVEDYVEIEESNEGSVEVGWEVS